MTDDTNTGSEPEPNPDPPNTTPQERGRGIFAGVLNMSADEVLFAFAVPIAISLAVVRFTAIPLGDVVMPTAASIVIFAAAIRDYGGEHGPYALGMRSYRHYRNRLRMPLLPGDARRQTRVRRTGATERTDRTGEITEMGYAERTDGSLIAIVGGEPLNTTRYARKDWGALAHRGAGVFDTALGKPGIDTQFQLSRFRSEAATIDTASLERCVNDDTERRDARTIAASTALHASEWEASAGILESQPRIVVSVGPNEGTSTGRTSRRGLLGMLRADDEQTTEQVEILKDRVKAARRTLQQSATDVGAYDETELRTTLRRCWRPHDSPPEAAETMTHIDESTAWGPKGLDEHRTHVVLNPDDPDQRDVVSSLWVSGTPVYPQAGILADVCSAEGVRLELAIHVETPDRLERVTEIDGRIDNLKRRISDIFRRNKSEGKARDTNKLSADLEELRDHAQDAEVEIPRVTITATVRGDSKEAVLDARSKLDARLVAVGCDTVPADGDQLAAFRTTTPIGRDDLHDALASKLDKYVTENVKNVDLELGTPTEFDTPSGGVGCFTHSAHGVRQDEDGVIYGMARATIPNRSTENNAGLLQVCRDDLSAPHRCLIARSGWGKTYLESAQDAEELLRERGADRLFILDIAENFEGVVHALGGEKVTFGESLVNPWAVGAEDGVDLVTELICVVLREEAAEEDTPTRSRVRETVRQTFKHAETEFGRVPVFDDYFDVLAEIQEGERDISARGTQGELSRWQSDATTLLSLLTQFDPDGEYGFMSPDIGAGEPATGDVPLDSRVILFDASEFEDKTGAAHGIISTLYLTLAYRASDGTETVLSAVDEAHKVFKSAAQAGRFEALVRAGRNRGLCFDFLSQADEDFSFDEALIIAKQASVLIFGNVGTAASPEAIQSFGVPPQEAELICGQLRMGETSDENGQYSEAVVLIEGDVYLVEFETHPIVSDFVTYEGSDAPTIAEGGEEWEAYRDASIAEHTAEAEGVAG